MGFYYDRGAMMEATLDAIGDFKRRQIHGIRRFGTAALDLVMIGTGLLGAYFEYTLSPWDFAGRSPLRGGEAGAGGRSLPGSGAAPCGWQSRASLATNGTLHGKALEIVRRHHPEGLPGASG